MAYVQPIESDYFKKYAVKLGPANPPVLPEALQPMAFRPERAVRTYNAQDIYWTVHGTGTAPLEKLTFFMKRSR